MDKLSCLIVFGAIFGVLMHCATAQTVHIVGDGMGWDIPSNSSVSYANWASGRTFIVGDILVFNFMTNQHDVLQVPQPSYNACTQDNGIGAIITAGPANVTLDTAGDHFYICTFGRHCQFGQRLAITVLPSAPTEGAPPTAHPTNPATPFPPSTQPEACAPTSPGAGGPVGAVTPPPAGAVLPNSGAASLAAGFLLVLVSAGLALSF